MAAMVAEKPRASPDALLALAGQEGRGRLKIFLGAAPGTGKTYAMLQAAKAARGDGIDVVAGFVETHGRRETQALLEGLELLRRQSIAYRGRIVEEFDLDAALARRPALLLVDEFAHTNVPGSRHPKRWQDVQEILAAGIDVWTTLNIQHLESLNDVVQRITRIRVRETVPDSVFDDADEIVLVDLPPEELLKRLAEGKVYVQDTAARAVENFFRPNNLLALRELALRRAAERIDSDLVERMQGHAIEGPWAAGERILVCVGPDEGSPSVVRHAKRLADLIGAPWIAVTVEHPGSGLSAAKRHNIDEALRLAESLGAETKTLVGSDLPQELLRFARFENVTQIVIGRSRAGFFGELFNRSLPHQLVRLADDIAVHVATVRSEEKRPGYFRGLLRSLDFAAPAWDYVWSALAVAAAVPVGRGLTALVTLPNVSMIFLMAVLFSAIRFGTGPAVLASFLSFLAYNFFFIEPLHTFTVAQPHELLALGIFLVIAVLTSAIAGRARHQAASAAGRVRATRRLYEFTRKMSALARGDEIVEVAAAEINAVLNRPTLVLLDERRDLALVAAWPPEDELDTASLSAARWAYEKNEPSGAGTTTLPTIGWHFLPLRSPQGTLGVIGVGQGKEGAPLDAEARALLETLAGQTASALERARLSREMTRVKTAAETERVRNILLASISHDFRTPLASILGSATSLIDYGEKLDAKARLDLLGQVRDEAEHLDAMVRNLLAMTRVEAGALELNRDWLDVRELMDRAVATAKRRGALQNFTVESEPELPYVSADQSLLDQALGNVVGNAVRYSGRAAHIRLAARRDGDAVALSVTDDGPGIPAETLPHVFEKFVRARNTGGDRGEGSGLGLAIAKGIVEAHGGTITAQSPCESGRGARFVIRLPLDLEPKA